MKNAKKSRRNRERVLRDNMKARLPEYYPWKVLATLVADLDYLLTDSEKARIHRVVRSRDYEGYLALSEDWGPQSMLPDGTLRAVNAARYQIVSLLRKYRFPSGDDQRTMTALKKFRAAEVTCRSFNQSNWRALAGSSDERVVNVFTYARSFLSKLLGEELPEQDILTRWSRHGPGANLDTRESHTSAYFKYAEWPYSCTKGALAEARVAIQSDPRWLGALEDSYRRKFNIPAYAILDWSHFWSSVLRVVPGNRITFVPKNSQTDRSIAIEPSMNLWLQLGVDGYMRRRLKRWGVDLDDQAKNQQMARLGSLHWDNPENFVTLDLAAASDTISVGLCKLLLPKTWFTYLMKLRSPCGVLGEEVISYEKISSMGNGFTFALESAIFTSVIYGVMREYSGKFDPDKCAVYGDDLIVPNTIAPQVITSLQLFGFSINEEKSFLQGPFRESCGADWLDGTPVRPVFLTTAPQSVADLWTDVNRLRRQLSLRFMCDESKTESLIDSWIPSKFKGVTGPCSDEAFSSYKHTSQPTMNGRFEGGLWRFETLVARPKPIRDANEFLFRKLMSNLAEHPVEPLFVARNSRGLYKGLRVASGGSRFTVTRGNHVTVGLAESAAEIWQSEYAEG